MTQLAVVTPSFAADEALFADLHRSVLEHTAESTIHHVIVPPSDVAVFAAYASDRCRVWSESELLPRRYRSPRHGWWVNLRRPWPPVRGWVLQQALKILLAGTLDVDVVVVVDSDVVFVRRVEVERLLTADGLGLIRLDDAVDDTMERHVIWHAVARRLLGLAPPPPPPLPDYVSSLNVWSPAVVRMIQQRIHEVTRRDWLDAFTSQLHISEFMLYGVFVDEVLAPTDLPIIDPTICHNYWDRVPLTEPGAESFADALPAHAVGMMISAKSRTPIAARYAANRRCAEIVAASAAPLHPEER